MPPAAHTERSNNHRWPGAMIRHGGWRSSRCPWRDRDLPEMVLEGGNDVPSDAFRQGGFTGGQAEANPRRRRRPRPGATWSLDEGLLTLHGQRHALGRAVEQDDNGLARVGQSRRHKRAATTLFRTLLEGLPDVLRAIITEKPKSSGAATPERLPGAARRQSRSLTNRGEHAHRLTRHRERRLQGVSVREACPACSGGVWPPLPPLPPPVASAVSVEVPRRDGESMRELRPHDGHRAGCLKGGEDRGEAPACLMSVTPSAT